MVFISSVESRGVRTCTDNHDDLSVKVWGFEGRNIYFSFFPFTPDACIELPLDVYFLHETV